MGTKLASPPIVEVVCGLFFSSVPGLDPIVLGKLWYDLREDYPQRAVQPPVREDGGLVFTVDAGPLRSWFISANDEYVIQIQPDRFYFNWRKREGGYPRFHDDDEGREKGVMSRALAEFERFAAFCETTIGVRPVANRVEVAKVDLLLEGTSWKDSADLSHLMPMLGTLSMHAGTDVAEVTVRIAETRAGSDFLLAVHCGVQSVFGAIPARGVRIETRAHRALDEGAKMDEALGALNDLLNHAFYALFPPAELARFEGAP